MIKPRAAPIYTEQAFVETTLGYHIRRLSVVVMSDLTSALGSLQLTPAEASTLLMIAAQPGITQSDVGRALGILRANMAPLAGNLFKRELIFRERVDGRSQAMHLTAQGKTMARAAKVIIRKHEARLFGGLSRSAQERMIAQLQLLWRRESRESEPPCDTL